MKALQHIILIFASATLLVSCAPDNASDTAISKKEQVVNAATTSYDKWTYYSLENARLVGESTFGDSIADKEWAERTDWDIALSGDLIRTNSGKSGEAQGGIIEKTGDYESFHTAPETGYETDIYE